MPSLRLVAYKVRWSLRHHGLRGTVRSIAATVAGRRKAAPLAPHPFDVQHGVDTGGLVTAANLASGQPSDIFITGYIGIPPSRFQFLLDRWVASPPQQPVSAYSFIDIGCGKGRALMLASGLPFQQIIGVELNPGLAHTASANLKKFRHSTTTAAPMRALCQDALDFAFPATPCLLYLYNPFASEMFHRLIQRLEDSFSADPRPLDVLYYNPAAPDPFASHPPYQQLWSGVVPISQSDAAADPFASVGERCTLYRRISG